MVRWKPGKMVIFVAARLRDGTNNDVPDNRIITITYILINHMLVFKLSSKPTIKDSFCLAMQLYYSCRGPT